MGSQFIEHYEFGKIRIDGKTYTNDLIILNEEIHSGWWREKGHQLLKKDLEKVLEYQPELLIVGKGYNGRMSVSQSLKKQLDFELQVYKTSEAITQYNRALDENKKVAAAFHLTC